MFKHKYRNTKIWLPLILLIIELAVAKFVFNFSLIKIGLGICTTLLIVIAIAFSTLKEPSRFLRSTLIFIIAFPVIMANTYFQGIMDKKEKYDIGVTKEDMKDIVKPLATKDDIAEIKKEIKSAFRFTVKEGYKPELRKVLNEKMSLGVHLAKTSDYNRAIQIFEEILEKTPEDPHVLNNLGIIYESTKMFDKAAAMYKQAMQKDSTIAALHNNLGILYLHQNKGEKAVEEFETAARLDPNCMEAHFNLGNCYYKRKLYNKAIKEYKTVTELDPMKDGWFWLGSAYLKKSISWRYSKRQFVGCGHICIKTNG